MYGIFVNSSRKTPYAWQIVNKIKPIETRNKNMLRGIIGYHVAIIETGHNKRPMIIGHADIVKAEFVPAATLDKMRDKTKIPYGTQFDCKGAGKWCYYLENAKPCKPYELPVNAVRHGRSYAEF